MYGKREGEDGRSERGGTRTRILDQGRPAITVSPPQSSARPNSKEGIPARRGREDAPWRREGQRLRLSPVARYTRPVLRTAASLKEWSPLAGLGTGSLVAGAGEPHLSRAFRCPFGHARQGTSIRAAGDSKGCPGILPQRAFPPGPGMKFHVPEMSRDTGETGDRRESFRGLPEGELSQDGDSVQ